MGVVLVMLIAQVKQQLAFGVDARHLHLADAPPPRKDLPGKTISLIQNIAILGEIEAMQVDDAPRLVLPHRVIFGGERCSHLGKPLISN